MRTWTAGIVVVLLVAAGVAYGVVSGRHSASAAPGPEVVPLETGTVLASAAGAAQGQAVDGVQCQATEQLTYHIHAHVAVYVDGRSRPIPLGIGIVTPSVHHTNAGDVAAATRCYYWLHTHAQDGVVHVESPTSRVYTLGDFFDEWGQPLTSTKVATATGPVTAFVNGKRFTGDPRSIPLSPHATVQLDVGSPAVAPKPVDWAATTL